MTAVISPGGGWATPSYCSDCHRNHPGACGCPCHLPAATGCALPKGTRLLAALALALPLAAGVAACAPQQPPSHFGNCPPRQHWADPSGSSFGWECVR